MPSNAIDIPIMLRLGFNSSNDVKIEFDLRCE